MTQAISWTLDLDIQPGRGADFTRLMNEMVTAVEAKEPGALFYEWNTTAEGTQCQIYERYRDSEAVMEHLAHFNDRFAALFLEILTPTRFVIYGEPNETVREALTPFNPTYMQFGAGFAR